MQRDQAIFDLISKEQDRQTSGIELIASENFTSPQVMEAMGSEEMANLGQILMEDEQKFIDHAASCAFIVNEIEF